MKPGPTTAPFSHCSFVIFVSFVFLRSFVLSRENYIGPRGGGPVQDEGHSSTRLT